jgi:hypothetical protein
VQKANGRADPAAERAIDPAGNPPFRPDARPIGSDPTDPANPADRYHPLEICPFFRGDHRGLLGPPIEFPDPVNRCIAIGAPQPQSARQQELVCLTAGHATCPRFVQGEVARTKALAKPAGQRGPSAPVIAAALALVAATAVSIGFLLVRGGLAMPVVSVGPSLVAVASPAPVVAGAAVASPSPTATAIPTASPTPEPTLSPTQTVGPTSTPTSEPTPPLTATPGPSSDRYALLKACPGAARCWIYTVRPGDNLQSIANYFGIPYPTVLDMNPQITHPTTIRAGDEIQLPPPTR